MIESLTAVLIFVTIVYAWSTHRIQQANENVVALMRQQLDQALRAYVSLGIHQFPGNPIFFLRIRNVGRTCASALKLTIDKPLWSFEGTGSDAERELNSMTPFSESIDSFPPDAELLVPINAGPFLFRKMANRDKSPLVFTISANYQSSSTQIFEQTTIDLRPFAHAHRPIDPLQKSLDSISEQLAKICDAVKSLSSS
jgi:hypothetical protein